MLKHIIISGFIALIPIQPAFSTETPTAATALQNCQSEQSLVTIRAGDVPALLGTPVNRIQLWRIQEQQRIAIVSQIDRRDEQGRYHLETAPADSKAPSPALSANDEIVFRLNDAGVQQQAADLALEQPELRADIQVNDPSGRQPRWVYATVAATQASTATPQIDYQPQTDSVLADQYKITFDHERPFMMDALHWQQTDQQGYSPNILNRMRIKHIGSLFGLIPFERTTEDYSSELTQVKVGPLRIIRRTENRVRILWYLKTPTVYIDYIMMPDGFIMDTIIDIPFKLGLFFDQIDTLTTIDWRDEPALPTLSISAPGTEQQLLVNGQMSAEKEAFNTLSGTCFSVQSDLGTASIQLDIPESLPIEPWLYLQDDSHVPPAPEQPAGVFGNVGYRTTGWEKVDTRVHHLKISTCLISGAAGHAR